MGSDQNLEMTIFQIKMVQKPKIKFLVASKESHFNADFKYNSFIKFRFTNQKLGA